MDNKTETPEEKEAFDAIERKQCQCAKVNPTNVDMERIGLIAKIKTTLEVAKSAAEGRYPYDELNPIELIEYAIKLLKEVR